MATIGGAIAAKALEVYDLPQWEVRQPIRQLWVNPELWDWVDRTPQLRSKRDRVGGRTLEEHLDQMFCDFRCSDPFPAGDLRRLMPNKHGVRSLHPPKLRIYGWCPGPHQFVAVTGALEAETKADKSLNDRKLKEVLRFIRRNQLERTVLLGDNRAIFPPQK
jgi:hypothetical protein